MFNGFLSHDVIEIPPDSYRVSFDDTKRMFNNGLPFSVKFPILFRSLFVGLYQSACSVRSINLPALFLVQRSNKLQDLQAGVL